MAQEMSRMTNEIECWGCRQWLPPDFYLRNDLLALGPKARCRECLSSKTTSRPRGRRFHEKKEYNKIHKILFPPGKIGLNFEADRVCFVAANSQARQFGVQMGWRVVNVQGMDMPCDAKTIIDAIKSFAGRPVELIFDTDPSPASKAITPKYVDVRKPNFPLDNGGPHMRSHQGNRHDPMPPQTILFHPGKIGLNFIGNIVSFVETGSQAERFGIQKGWCALTVQGRKMPADADIVIGTIKNLSGQDIEIVFGLPPLDFNPNATMPGHLDVLNPNFSDGPPTDTNHLLSFPHGPIGIGHRGSIIDKVIPGSPADKFGIRPGWRIRAVNGLAVEDDTQSVREIISRARKQGNHTKILFSPFGRDERLIPVTFLPGPMGIKYRGNLVTEVTPRTPADRANVCNGWIIESINGQMQCDDTDVIDKAIDRTYAFGKPTRIVFLETKRKLKGRITHKMPIKPTVAMKERLVRFPDGPIGIGHQGHVILNIVPGSTAEKAGVLIGWQIISVNGANVSDNTTEVRMAIQRARDREGVAEIAFMTHERLIRFPPGSVGIVHRGNFIEEVLPGSPANIIGVSVGWLIKSVNDRKLPNDTHIIREAIRRARDEGKGTHIVFSTQVRPPDFSRKLPYNEKEKSRALDDRKYRHGNSNRRKLLDQSSHPLVPRSLHAPICISCSKELKGRRAKWCQSCGVKQPEKGSSRSTPALKKQKWRDGDWLCKACGDHQFSRNSKCRKCGASKLATKDEKSRKGDDSEKSKNEHTNLDISNAGRKAMEDNRQGRTQTEELDFQDWLLNTEENTGVR